ncbi:hypothetical protein VWO27_10410, partial [Campylobacter coli]|nr:hypothetical protein [Campylobacter coli]
GDIPQDISYKDEQKSGVIIGQNSTIREFATINSGTAKGDGFTTLVCDNLYFKNLNLPFIYAKIFAKIMFYLKEKNTKMSFDF